MKKEPRKKTRRNQRKYPNLEPQYNLKSRYEQIDYDYIDKLSEKDKAYLNKFTKEFVNADLDKNEDNNLHNTKKLKKDCYDRNNARNRDILTRAKANGSIVDYEELREKSGENDEENDRIEELNEEETSDT